MQVAVLGFEKSYKSCESKDSILGYIDTLTELPNRRAFDRDKESIDEHYSLIMIDIDNFKNINDTKGHLFGDNVLKRLAAVLAQVVEPGGKVYRFAGDEFVVIVPSLNVASICNAIRSNLRKEDSFTVSQGIVVGVNNQPIPQTLHQADVALYQSKAKGKDTITYAVPNLAPVG